MAKLGTVKVRILARGGDEFELRRDVARRSGLLKNQMVSMDGQVFSSRLWRFDTRKPRA